MERARFFLLGGRNVFSLAGLLALVGWCRSHVRSCVAGAMLSAGENVEAQDADAKGLQPDRGVEGAPQ